MDRYPPRPLGLETVVHSLTIAFEYDENGRIVGNDSLGRSPRFVLGRAREGVVWRLRRGLSASLVVQIARLAGREKGIPIESDAPLRPPERLAAIARLIGESPGETEPSVTHEWVTHDGVAVGELWLVD